MALTTIQNAFSAGEVSPSLFGRTDLLKYHQGCSTLRNMYVNYRGGISSRAGTAYVGMCKQGAPNSGGTATNNPPRDINFQFNINQGYALEFGDQYMRIKSNGAYVIEATKSITAITKANPAVFTSAAHGYSNGDWIFIAGGTGMTNFNGLVWIVVNVTTNTFQVTDLFGGTVDSTLYSTYTGGGTAARIYTVVAPYAAVDLPYLKFTESADAMSLTCVNQESFVEYPTYELVRNAATNWTFTQVSFASSINPPAAVSVVATSSTTLSTWYSYVVTAIDNATGEESVASEAVYVQNNDISINAGSNTINWSGVAGASEYNIYKATPSYNVQVPVGVLYGFMGSAFGTQITDTNITADFTRVPPTHQDPFARSTITDVVMTATGTGYNQSTAGYTITTSTGSGFIGIPVVVNGGISAVVIENGGHGYGSGDTITFTGGPGFATGTYTFTGNPTNGQTIVLNGVTWTFETRGATGNQTNIQTNVQATVAQLVVDLNSSANSSINVASYGESVAVGGASIIVNITYKTPGTGGNAYTLVTGTYGGAVSAANLAGGGATTGSATATLTIGPATGTYPGTVAYFQQRRFYGYTLDNPDTFYASQPGAFTNMDSSTPTVDDDAIVGTPWAQQINGIQFMVPMTGGLVILTGSGAWNLTGGNNAAITPSDETATAQAYNGCNAHIQPIVINYDILYVQAKGSIVRDLSYNFFVNIYTGADKTVYSNHLFNFHQLQQWAYAEEPNKIIWAVRDDGTMLSLTFLKEQEVEGWARHDTNGFFVGVCSVTEPPVDAVYVITKRYIQGHNTWVYYSERMDNRNWQNVEDCFCVDAGLQYPMTFPNATLQPVAAEGTSNITSVVVNIPGSGYTSPTIIAEDPTNSGSGASFTATLSGGTITAINVISSGQDYAQGTQLTITDPTGNGAVAVPIVTNNVTFNASASVFNSGMVGDIIRIGNNNAAVATTPTITASGGGKAVIISYVSGTQVVANIIEPITNTIPNDPFNTPSPVAPNQWSIAVPTQTVSDLNHLEGMQVSILADGSVMPVQTVTNGTVSLNSPSSAITIGLAFQPQMQTLYLDAPAEGGTIQGKRKNIYAVTVRVEESRGFSVGTNQPDQSTQPNDATIPWTDMKEVKQRNATVQAGTAIPLFTGDIRVNVPAEWKKPAQVAVEQNYPLPLNILATMPERQDGDSPG